MLPEANILDVPSPLIVFLVCKPEGPLNKSLPFISSQSLLILCAQWTLEEKKKKTIY